MHLFGETDPENRSLPIWNVTLKIGYGEGEVMFGACRVNLSLLAVGSIIRDLQSTFCFKDSFLYDTIGAMY